MENIFFRFPKCPIPSCTHVFNGSGSELFNSSEEIKANCLHLEEEHAGWFHKILVKVAGSDYLGGSINMKLRYKCYVHDNNTTEQVPTLLQLFLSLGFLTDFLV